MLGGRVYLAAEGAETEDCVNEFPAAHQACTAGARALDGVLQRLRPRVEVHHPLMVDHVWLHQGHVRNLLQLCHPDHHAVFVGRPPYLQ